MEPSQYVRLLKRRWLVLFVFVAVFASLGYASTLLSEEDPGPVITRWTAAQILVVDQDAEQVPDLQLAAVFATSGDVVDRVAEERGVPREELAPTLRTVSDRTEGKITISAVASTPEDARDVAQRITEEFLVEINKDSAANYQTQLDQLAQDVEARLDEVTALDATIDLLLAVQDSEVELTSAQADDLRRAQASRETALSRLATAEEARETLEKAGPPESPLVILDEILPFRISEREYNSRIAEGRQGQRDFDVGQVSLADTSSPTVSERLESPAARALLGGLAGLVLGIMAVLVHARMDPRIRSKEQAEEAFGLPILADIPIIVRKDRKADVLHARDKPRSAIAEAYRYLRSVLLFSRAGAQADPAALLSSDVEGVAGREVRVVMVTSAGQGEGKTTTAANLAVLMAEAGHDTVLVNCDFRLPSAHKLIGLDYEPGTVAETSVPNLRFIADVERTDNDTPGQVSERQRTLIRRARELTDLIILDTAPVLATNDAIDILPETDLVVLVAREAKTTADAAREARELLIDRMGVPVAGVVLTAAGAGLGTGYYEKYRYGNYFDKGETLFAVGREATKQKRGAKPSRASKAEAKAAAKAEAKAAKAAAKSRKAKPVVPDAPIAGAPISPTDQEIARQMEAEAAVARAKADAAAHAAAEAKRLAEAEVNRRNNQPAGAELYRTATPPTAPSRSEQAVQAPTAPSTSSLSPSVQSHLSFDIEDLFDNSKGTGSGSNEVDRNFHAPGEIDLRIEDRWRSSQADQNRPSDDA